MGEERLCLRLSLTVGRDVVRVPAAALARPSTPPILWKNTGGIFSAALVWCWLQERFTLPSGRARRPWMLFTRNPSRFQQRRLRQAGPACSSKRLKKKFSNLKSNINKAASHKKSTKNPKRRWIRRLSVH